MLTAEMDPAEFQKQMVSPIWKGIDYHLDYSNKITNIEQYRIGLFSFQRADKNSILNNDWKESFNYLLCRKLFQ